ncbi:hypothetical protein ACSGFO_24965 [Mesorhizobium sp. WSM4083]
MATTTGLTFDAGLSILDFTGVGDSAGQRIFSGGGLTYSSVRFRGQVNGASLQIIGANSFTTLTNDGPNVIELSGLTQTIATLTINGSPSSPVLMRSSSDGSSRTLSVASNAPTINGAALRDITGAGGASFVANNSFDLGHNSGITINGPAGGHIATRQQLGM